MDVSPVSWSVSLRFALPAATGQPGTTGPGAAVLDVLDTFDMPDRVVSIGDDHVAMRFSVPATEPDAAIRQGVRQWRQFAEGAGMESWPLVHADAATYEVRQEQFRATALPRLVGVEEVAEAFDVPPEEILLNVDMLPLPVAKLASGPVWAADGIELFLKDSLEALALPGLVAPGLAMPVTLARTKAMAEAARREIGQAGRHLAK